MYSVRQRQPQSARMPRVIVLRPGWPTIRLHHHAAPQVVTTAIFWVALPCLFIVGFAQVITGVAAQTLIQSAVDPQMRGRILSLYGMIFRGGPAVGALVFGIVGSHLGLRVSVAISAATGIAVFLYGRQREARIAAALEVDTETG